MDDHIRKLDTKIQSKETELNALFTKIQKLEEEIATLHHKKLISKKLESAEMTLTGVLEVILKTEEEEEVNEYTASGPEMGPVGPKCCPVKIKGQQIRQFCWGCQNDAPGPEW